MQFASYGSDQQKTQAQAPRHPGRADRHEGAPQPSPLPRGGESAGAGQTTPDRERGPAADLAQLLRPRPLRRRHLHGADDPGLQTGRRPGADLRRLHARHLRPLRLLHRHGPLAAARARPHPRPERVMALDVEMLTVGQIGENCCLFRPRGGGLLIVDPGEEAERILAAVEAMGGSVEAILLTHCHFDHIGAVAPVARATGAPVYCPEIEVPVLADIMAYVPWAGFGPYESYEADETVAGGETLELAGLELDVVFTPGHSPGHVTYAVRGEPAIFSGDVLFQGSVGRVDLPGADGPTLIESIRALVDGHSAETTVYPGHMGITTLGAEREANPFLAELAP